MTPESFDKNLRIAKKSLNAAQRIYVVDAYAGWDPERRLKIRVICTRYSF